MFSSADWISLGNTKELIEELQTTGFLKEVTLQEERIVISYHEGQFGAVHARCNHMGGPLAKGKIKKGCIECPWHYWEFHHQTGEAMNRAHEPLASHGGRISTYPLIAAACTRTNSGVRDFNNCHGPTASALFYI